jgi:tetratricopeptide (TPR) repeat protein
MSDDIRRQQARVLFEQAYRHQMKGELADALLLYRRSLELVPTAEAFTFLGWTYSMLDRYDEAIAACHEAIGLDPEFGNPYNDIGAYLIELDRFEEALSWLEQATEAARYDTPHFAHMNLGRAYESLRRFATALAHYDKALALAPFYRPAYYAKYGLLGKVN